MGWKGPGPDEGKGFWALTSNERASSSQRSKGTFLAAVTVRTTRAWPAVTVKSKQSPVIVDEGPEVWTSARIIRLLSHDH